MLKKITLAILGLTATSFAAAGTMGPVCTPGNVTVPCEAKGWDLGIQALYLRSVYDADKSYQRTPINGFSEISNDWDWGFRLEGSYHFNTGNDISLNWTHYSGDSSQLGLLGAYPLTAQTIRVSQYSLYGQNKFDQINLEMGQHVDLGMMYKLRFYGGLQYAYIQSSITNYYSTAFNATNTISLFDNSDFRGVGPVAGIDYAYDITSALSLTANGSGSILYGTNRYNSGYVLAPTGLVLASGYASKKAIVPSLEAKLGLNYALNTAQGVWNLEGGYQVVNYFNALQTQTFNNLLAGISNSDYGLYGPYFGVKYVGAA